MLVFSVLYEDVDNRHLSSFPTRRSSDLGYPDFYLSNLRGSDNFLYHNNHDGTFTEVGRKAGVAQSWRSFGAWFRSEEHTSELQSRRDLVCRLLLEKKNARRTGQGACPIL